MGFPRLCSAGRHRLNVGSGSHTWEHVTKEAASDRAVTSFLPPCSSWKRFPRAEVFQPLQGVALPPVPKFQTNYWVHFVFSVLSLGPTPSSPSGSLQTLPGRRAGRKSLTFALTCGRGQPALIVVSSFVPEPRVTLKVPLPRGCWQCFFLCYFTAFGVIVVVMSEGTKPVVQASKLESPNKWVHNCQAGTSSWTFRLHAVQWLAPLFLICVY